MTKGQTIYEFDFFNGMHFITFNLIACNEDNANVTVAITNQGKITQDSFALLKDSNDNLYLEYALYYNKIYLNDLSIKIKGENKHANRYNTHIKHMLYIPLPISIVIDSWRSYNEGNKRALGSNWLDLADYLDWKEIEEELQKQDFELNGVDEKVYVQDIESIPTYVAT